MRQNVVSIGVDIAKSKFDAAFRYEGEESLVDTFENTEAGIKKFLRSVKKQKTALAVPCVLESTGLYHLNLALRIHSAGYQVNVINPIITKKYQQSSIRNAKTDTIDALRLAEIGIKETKLPVFSGNIQCIETKKLVCYMGKLEEIKQQLKASMDQVVMMVEITGMKTNLRPTETAIKNIEKQIICLKARICMLAPKSAKTLADNVYGLSHEKVAVILAMLGDKQFTNRDQIVAFAGLDVIPRQSGTWHGKGRLSKRGNPYLRKILYQVAWGLKQNNLAFKAHYMKLREKGMNYVTTLIVLARKFLRFLYTWYWKNNACPQMSF